MAIGSGALVALLCFAHSKNSQRIEVKKRKFCTQLHNERRLILLFIKPTNKKIKCKENIKHFNCGTHGIVDWFYSFFFPTVCTRRDWCMRIDWLIYVRASACAIITVRAQAWHYLAQFGRNISLAAVKKCARCSCEIDVAFRSEWNDNEHARQIACFVWTK